MSHPEVGDGGKEARNWAKLHVSAKTSPTEREREGGEEEEEGVEMMKDGSKPINTCFVLLSLLLTRD